MGRHRVRGDDREATRRARGSNSILGVLDHNRAFRGNAEGVAGRKKKIGMRFRAPRPNIVFGSNRIEAVGKLQAGQVAIDPNALAARCHRASQTESFGIGQPLPNSRPGLLP